MSANVSSDGSVDAIEALQNRRLFLTKKFLNKEAPQLTVFEVVQPAGTIMITAPGAYHAGYNVGFNVARSMNFSTPASIDYALVAQTPIDRLNANAGADANANANSRKDKGKGKGKGKGKDSSRPSKSKVADGGEWDWGSGEWPAWAAAAAAAAATTTAGCGAVDVGVRAGPGVTGLSLLASAACCTR